VIDISTGKEMTRRDFGRGLSAIIAAGVAPSISLGAIASAGSANASVGGMMRNVGARVGAMLGNNKPYTPVSGLYSDGTAWTVIPHYHSTPTKCKVEARMLCKEYQNSCNPFQGAVNDIGWMCGIWYLYDQVYPFAGSYFIDISTRQILGVFVEYVSTFSNGTLYGHYGDIAFGVYVGGSIARAYMGIFVQTNGSARYSANVCTNTVIGEFRYYDGDELIADLIPCIENDTGEAAFYNSVDCSFLRPSNGGRFLVYNP